MWEGFRGVGGARREGGGGSEFGHGGAEVGFGFGRWRAVNVDDGAAATEDRGLLRDGLWSGAS